jgi:hypothetical protein
LALGGRIGIAERRASSTNSLILSLLPDSTVRFAAVNSTG